ncbi:helix-turn-helix transcriptional regulator [Vibrio quintilis]|uniref:Bacterial regulatory proteins, luxR family n=1 Tax=Vibrio quintilis TaxID=1117707 RepID=A0A1M7YSH0_9VIBR|nr:LuxR C-terminal-related transcriptional regulator [Vibrio quintilis]SHO55567.1 Bacterial regulatory proteins, luxR family [Vibrio quintilis]
MRNYTATVQVLVNQDIDRIFMQFPDLGLTKKQFSVVYMFANGYSDKNIAAHTETSIDNVKNHIDVARKKLNCGTRTDLRMVYLTRLVSTVLNR